MITNNRDLAVVALKHGEIIAYPTEAVFGLGCDPFNPSAVEKLLALKHRSVSKGLILIAHDWNQVAHLVKPIDETALQRAQNSWPGPFTWVFPASDSAPAWICGDHPSIALRVTQHPIASALCEAFGGPIVSTSANIDGSLPAKSAMEVEQVFQTGVAIILDGPLGESKNPTSIKNVLTGEVLRK